MAAKQKLQWLIREVEQLEEKAVIDAQSVLAIKNHYQPQLEKGDNFANKVGVAILAAIGSLLIGGGIILVFAHNWQEFSRPVRALLAMLPVVVAVGLMCFCVVREKSRSWREASATLMTTAAISCFALICQTYYLGGKFSTFMFYVALMTCLIPLILPSLAGFILYLVIVVTWEISFAESYLSDDKLVNGLKLLLLVITPIAYYVLSLRKSAGWEKAFNSWLMAIAASIISCIAIAYFADDDYSIVLYLALGCTISVLANLSYYIGKKTRKCSVPFVLAGFIMTIIPLIIIQVGDFYTHLDPSTNFVTILFALIALVAGAVGFWKRVWVSSAIALLPGIFLILHAFDGSGSGLPAIVISIIVGIISLAGIILAMTKGSLEILNYSTVLLLSVILVRFFDGDFSILARAIAFIICGVGLLALNGITVMTRRKKLANTKEAL